MFKLSLKLHSWPWNSKVSKISQGPLVLFLEFVNWAIHHENWVGTICQWIDREMWFKGLKKLLSGHLFKIILPKQTKKKDCLRCDNLYQKLS